MINLYFIPILGKRPIRMNLTSAVHPPLVPDLSDGEQCQGKHFHEEAAAKPARR
ncbi:MAG: hypothetical protein ANABAC_3404 [Anaerolineae bacterium]|nr:MAG: hypothetical protein ANABAC_3404 [Anaerolineae bacterium]